MRKRTQRGWLICASALLLSLSAMLVAFGLQDSLIYFHAPSEIAEQKLMHTGKHIRIGGLVLENSVLQKEQGATQFSITDGQHHVPVLTRSPLPSLFNEGQGVVAEGYLLKNGMLEASRVLARHDENYMPREAYEALRRAATKP